MVKTATDAEGKDNGHDIGVAFKNFSFEMDDTITFVTRVTIQTDVEPNNLTTSMKIC